MLVATDSVGRWVCSSPFVEPPFGDSRPCNRAYRATTEAYSALHSVYADADVATSHARDSWSG